MGGAAPSRMGAAGGGGAPPPPLVGAASACAPLSSSARASVSSTSDACSLTCVHARRIVRAACVATVSTREQASRSRTISGRFRAGGTRARPRECVGAALGLRGHPAGREQGGREGGGQGTGRGAGGRGGGGRMGEVRRRELEAAPAPLSQVARPLPAPAPRALPRSGAAASQCATRRRCSRAWQCAASCGAARAARPQRPDAPRQGRDQPV